MGRTCGCCRCGCRKRGRKEKIMKAMSIKWKLVTAWNALRYRMEESLNNEEGIGTVEIVLLILVAVGLVLIF